MNRGSQLACGGVSDDRGCGRLVGVIGNRYGNNRGGRIMYLTQIPIVQGDDYKQHQNVKKIFPGDQKVLFQQHDAGVLVLSASKPIGALDTKEANLSTFVEGGKYAFSLRLNPVKRDIKTH